MSPEVYLDDMHASRVPMSSWDWSLITGRREGGGYRTVGGGHEKFYPYEKVGGGGAEQVLAMLMGGTKCFGVVFKR